MNNVFNFNPDSESTRKDSRNKVFGMIDQVEKGMDKLNNPPAPEPELLPDGKPAPDVNTLAASYAAGDKTVLPMLMPKIKPAIDRAIKAYANGDEDLRSQAELHALRAVKSYDPEMGTDINTHIQGNLQRLYRVSAQRSNFVKVPEGFALDKRRMEKAEQELHLENGREPTLAELADHLVLPIRRVMKMKAYKGYTSDSATMNEHGDAMGAAARNPFDLYKDYVYMDMDPTNKKIFEWKTGYGGTSILPPSEISRRLGISQAAVSQRSTAIDRLMMDAQGLINENIH